MSPTTLAAVVNEAKDTQLFVRGKLEEYIMLKNKLANCCQRVTLLQDFHAVLQTHKQVGKSQVGIIENKLFCYQSLRDGTEIKVFTFNFPRTDIR